MTIGWFPRERFSIAAESLETLLETSPPCRLIIVDPGTPPRYMEEICHVLGDHPAEVVSIGRPILPCDSKNLILDRVDTDYVALVENDVLFPPGWLEQLVDACEQAPADVATPLIIEGRGHSPHFDHHLGVITESQLHPGKYEVLPESEPRDSISSRQQVTFVEQHCLVYRTSTFDRIGRFRHLNTRDEVDLSLALWDAGCMAVVEPEVQVHYVGPREPPFEDEMPFYSMRWDLDKARESRQLIRDRWNLVETPGDLGFVKYRNLMAQLPRVRRDLTELSGGPHPTVLLENGDWIGTDITEGLNIRPFPNANGRFGGFPSSDEAAIAELEEAFSAAGARRVVVGFPAFWWFDYLPGLARRLNELCRIVRDDELLRVFERASASVQMSRPSADVELPLSEERGDKDA